MFRSLTTTVVTRENVSGVTCLPCRAKEPLPRQMLLNTPLSFRAVHFIIARREHDIDPFGLAQNSRRASGLVGTWKKSS